MKRLLILATLACFSLTAAAPVWAAEHGAKKTDEKKGDKKDGEKKDEKKPPKKPAKKEEGGGKVGYSTTVIQMMPMMAPYRTSSGTRYELISARLELPSDDNPRGADLQRGACFLVPVVHEAMVLYLASAKLQYEDFSGPRRDVLAKALYDVVVKTTDKSLYTGLKLVDPGSPPLTDKNADVEVFDNDAPLSQRSLTLTAQCK